MAKTVIIFLPNNLEEKAVGYLHGFRKNYHNNSEAFYVTQNGVVSKNDSQTVGYVGRDSKKVTASKPLVFINACSGDVKLLNELHEDNQIVIIRFDYKSFSQSDLMLRNTEGYGMHFKALAAELRKTNSDNGQNGKRNCIVTTLIYLVIIIDYILKMCRKLNKLLSCSHTFSYFEETTRSFKWFIEGVLAEKKLTPKLGNALAAKIIDIILGIVLLQWFLQHKDDVLYTFQSSAEIIISNLKGLLTYLMGSPIGLKLNHAFNRSLGQFFFYHISLWRLFLHGVQPIFATYFKFLVLPGALGASFQIAMFADIISIATFHVYCIYVYAARLFNLQLRGIISLWRLFIGRKLNPLRNRVDSCKYSANQLLIGTMGFTVLLFLLPTTTMYYTVFSMFRFLILIVSGMLQGLRYLLNALPVYVILLWMLRSSSIAGTIHINWNERDRSGSQVFEAKLNLLPLSYSIINFVPDTLKYCECYPVSHLLHCAITGTLI